MRKYVAEFIVAFFLVFAGAGAIVADHYLQAVRITESFGFLGIALAHGLALAIAIAAVGRISGGHGNPAVSLAAWVARRLSGADLAGYIVAQLLGGTVAALLLRGLLPNASVTETSLGVPALAEGIGVLPGVAIEIILTFFLVITIWGTAVDRRGNNTIAPLAIGLVLVFDILAGGPFTGAAMNPARWFGPAILSGPQWGNAVVWIAGPIVGALLGSIVYEQVFLTDQPPDEDDLEINGEGEDDEDEDLILEAELFEAEKAPEVVEPPTPERAQPPPRPTVDVSPPRESPPLSPPSPPQQEPPPSSPGDRVWGSPRDDEDRPTST